MTAVSQMPPATPVEPSGLLALAIRRPVGMTMIVLALLVFGFVGFRKLPVTLLPELSYPTVTVRTAYAGASPEDVEDRVSEPIREAVSVLGSVIKVTSISRSGQSDVIVEFAWGTPMLHAVSDLREKLDRAFLPQGIEAPLILRYDPSLDPIMTLGLSGQLGQSELRFMAEEEIERGLAEVEGVAAVKVKGGDEKEVLIALDPTKLTALGLDIRDIAQRIGAENLNASAGTLEEGQTEYLVRALNEFQNLDEVRNLIVARRATINVRLADVGRVEASVREKEVITRINGAPAVLIEVYKEADANLVSLARRLKDALFGNEEQRRYVAELKGKPPADEAASGEVAAAARPAGGTPDSDKGQTAGKDSSKEAGAAKDGQKDAAKKGGHQDWGERARHARLTNFIAHRLPRDCELSLLTDPAQYIRSAIDEVLESALQGGLLAVLILYVFLRQARPTLLISLSIPLSLIVTFAPLQLSGITLNVMSLGGLALGVGMLVDNSIVVLESITRCREEGDSLVQAAFRGVKEVSAAVVSSTLTTLAVFVPIIFVEGVAGQLFRDQAIAVVVSLSVSLLVALFLLPMLAARGQRQATADLAEPARPPRWLGRQRDRLAAALMRGGSAIGRGTARLGRWIATPPVKVFAAVYDPFERGYAGLLRGALRHRWAVLGTSAVMLAFALWRLPSLGTEVLPEVHQGEFQVLAFLARDVDVERTDRVLEPLEQAIRKLDGVKRTFLTAGVGRDELKSSEEGKHSARVHVVLQPSSDLVAAEEAARRQIRALLDREPAVESYRFQTPTLFTISTPVSVEILGHNLTNLRIAAQTVKQRLAEIPELRDVRSTLARGNTEVVLRFDRDRLAQVGLDIGEAARRVSTMVQGEVPTRFPEREKKIDMRVRLDPEEVEGVRLLRQLDLAKGGGTPILLDSVAELTLLEGPSEIRRLGGRRGAEVQATVTGLDLGGVQKEVEAALSGLALPPGVELQLGGQKQEMEESQRGMVQALLLAVFLVYVVMAAQFESLLQPLVIMLTVPLALVGVVLALDALGIPLSIVVFLGCIILAGIVVNNAIVLIDRINQERARGQPLLEAVARGAAVRLRPVLMTTLTTVLGLLPLTGWVHLSLLGGSGEGVELRAPMAITVIAGLLSSTILTLVVIPVVYSLVARQTATPAAAEA